LQDVSRFFGVPADLIDAAIAGGPNITYANITQRNLQFLVMHLGPAVVRRENALSQLLPRPRFVKLNSDALLRMDPLTRAQMIQTQIQSRVLAPNEARALDNRKPFTPEQIKSGAKVYNFGTSGFGVEEAPGISVFYRDKAGNIFHTYSCLARGLDMMNAAYHYLDLTPLGRHEEGLPYPMDWLRLRDQYEPAPSAAACCHSSLG